MLLFFYTFSGPIIVLSFILENLSAAGTSLPPLNKQMSTGSKSNFAVKHANLNKVYCEVINYKQIKI